MTFKQEMELLKKQYNIKKYSYLNEENYHKFMGTLAVFKMPTTARQVEKAIVAFMQYKGHQCGAVDTQGSVREGESYKVAGGVIKGKTVRLPTAGTVGAADLSATMYGIAVHIEVKFSKGDRQSKKQKEFQAKVMAAGGIYFVTKGVDHFREQYYELLEHPQIKLMKDYADNNS